MTPKIKLGRPSTGDEPDIVRSITFKLDEDTATKLDDLISDEPVVRGRTSVLLRRLIQAEFARRNK